MRLRGLLLRVHELLRLHWRGITHLPMVVMLVLQLQLMLLLSLRRRRTSISARGGLSRAVSRLAMSVLQALVLAIRK